MARRLTHRDLRALSESIRVLYQSSDLESFPRRVFDAVRPLVRCDYFSYNEFSHDGTLRLAHCEPALPESAMQFLVEIGPDFSTEHPTVSYVARTHSPEPYKITDFTSQRQWRQTRLYADFFRPLECEYQMAFASPVGDGQVALAFNSTRRDYSEEDRLLLELLRPHLMQAHANAQMFTRLTDALSGTGGAFVSANADGTIAHATRAAMDHLQQYFGMPAAVTILPAGITHWLLKAASPLQRHAALVVERNEARLTITLASREANGTCNLLLEEKRDSATAEKLKRLGLTSREAEILIWVARGKTSGEIAAILGSKTATVSKHLDHVYQKLGVENRTAAAAYVTRG